MKFKISLTTTAMLMMEMTIFIALSAQIRVKRKALHLIYDGTNMICTFFDSKSAKALFNVSDFFREGQKIKSWRKWQAPLMVVGAEVHENCYFEPETDIEESDTKVSNEDLVSNREIENPKETSCNAIPSIFSVYESQKTLKLTTDTLDCDSILVNQENDSVLNTVRSWISNGKLPTKDVESRQCKGRHGYAN